MSKPRSIPSLDGLRALSIGLVMLSHAAGTAGSPIPVGIHRLADWGLLGVRAFFVISGYLITRLLLDEHARHGSIDLRAFYWRRFTRIFPPFYAYLAVLALASMLGLVMVPPRSFAAAAAYVLNYTGSGSWHVGHSWSLSVEEQFYLLWPAAMLWAGTRRGWRVALAVVLLAPLVRLAEYRITGTTDGTNRRFEAVADALAMGCLLAYAQPWLAAREWWRRALDRGVGYLLPLVAVAGATMGDHPLVDLGAGQTVTLLALALLLDWTVRSPETGAGRLLNSLPLRVVGMGSYSLYLWQQPFLHRLGTDWWTAWPLNVVLACALAVASYHLVEQPALSWRRRVDERRAEAPPVLVGPGTHLVIDGQFASEG